MNTRDEQYARGLSALIRQETVSVKGGDYAQKFRDFHALLETQFPHIFSVCEVEDFDGALLLRWKGQDSDALPVMFMNHHDVVEATGEWKYPAFSGTVAEGKVWGRGALDTKGGLWAMLQAAEELAAEGFAPRCDIYFQSGRDEETEGLGAMAISKALEERGVRLSMVLDEGGMIVYEPIDGAKGSFAMIGVGEKGCCDLRFVARAQGGHASTPPKNTPLVRLGRFMSVAEREMDLLFPSELCPPVKEMLRRMAPTMKKGALKRACTHIDELEPLLKRVMPAVSPTAAAMLRTTLAFTMAKGSEGCNVLPHEAWVVGNMRFSHHQGGEASREAIAALAKRYDIQMEIIDPGVQSAITDYQGEAFQKLEAAVRSHFPGVIPAPYLMTGATDSHSFCNICDNVLRFLPFTVTNEQRSAIHTVNENIDVAALAPAVDFYKYLMREA